MAPSAPEPGPEREAGVVSAKERAQPSASSKPAGVRSELPLLSIPDHELLRCIGRGAYGAVWLARNVMGSFRAVKIVHREDFARDRPFTREYEGLLKFEPISRSHPNLMQILHVGRRDGCFYYVTELADDANGERRTGSGEPTDGANASGGTRKTEGELEGNSERGTGNAEQEKDVPHSTFPVPRCFNPVTYVPRTLQEDLERRGRLPIRESVRLATALASALKHLHDHGLVHRDVKPSNVIFVHGVPKLADIGLVATAGDSRSIVGTEGYLPPEGPGSPQADLYALGKLLYEMSTGMSRRDYPRLPQNLRDLPDAPDLLEFNELLLKACARDTERRYRQADELLADLALLERGDSVKRLRRLERRQAVLKRVGVGLLTVGLLISVAWWQSWRAQRIANRYLAQLHVDEGTRRMVRGDYTAALPWLVGALHLDAGDAALERVHRVRIGSLLQRCPLPVAHLSVPESKVLAADLNQHGTVVATAHEDGWVRLWNTRSGELVQQLSHKFPVVLCQFLSSGNRMLTITIGQKAHVWDLASAGRDPLTFDQAMGAPSDSYAVGLNQRLGRAYLAKGKYRFARIHPFAGPFENLTLSLKLIGQGDSLLVQYEFRRAGADGTVLYRGEFRDTPEADPFAEGHDTPAVPIWGRVYVEMENGSFGDLPGDTGRVIWDNLRVRRYPSGEPPSPWRVVDHFSSGQLTNWVHVAPPAEKRTCRVENGQLVLSCEQLPTAQGAIGGTVVRLEPFEISRDHTLEVAVDLISARAPHPVVVFGLCRPTLTPFTAPDRPFILRDRWLALTWWDATIRIWDLEKGRFATAQSDGIVDVDLRPDGQYLASVGFDGRCSVWDLQTGPEVTRAAPDRPAVTGARFSPDGRFLALSKRDGLELIRTEDWQPVQTLETGVSLAQPRFSPRGSRLAAVRDAREVIVWDLSDRAKPLATFAHDFGVKRIVFSPDGRFLASDSGNGLVQVWDVVRGERFGPSLPGALARFSADGSQLLMFGAEGGVWLWDLSRMVCDPLAVPPLVAEEPFASSTDQAMTAEIKGQGIALRTPTGQYSLVPPVPVSLRRIAFSPDNQYLIAQSTDLRSWIWDLHTRTLAAPPMPARYDATLQTYSSPNLPLESRDRRTLSDLAALLGGQRPDGKGGVTPVDAEAQARLFGSLKQAHPAEFDVDDTSRVRWHQEQAERSELAMAWDAAAFHWEHALNGKSEIRNPKSEIASSQLPIRNSQFAIALESRLAHARQAAEAIRKAILEGRSRWSVILPRQPWVAPAMLDLGGFYTQSLGEPLVARQPEAAFRDLPSGVQSLGGIGFDVRGIIHLKRTNHVTIPVGRACRRIHFLHAASQETSGNRETVGVFQVVYAGGEREKVELINPEQLPPYLKTQFYGLSSVATTMRTSGSSDLDSVTAWVGCNFELARRDQALFLTRTTWELPAARKEKVVATLELQPGPAESAPLVFAITVQ